MIPYGNLSGHSGVTHYDPGPDFIRVRFRKGDIYRYTYARPGREHVERMKTLAGEGRGLSTYISQYVRDAYERKE